MSRETDRILAECALIRADIEAMRASGNRLDIYIHFPSATPGGGLERIEAQLQTLITKETQQMALGQDILDKVTAQTTLIGSVKALVQGLIDNHTIPAEQGAAILAALSGNQTELAAVETALLAGVTPPPTP